jgi:hypothetical protein
MKKLQFHSPKWLNLLKEPSSTSPQAWTFEEDGKPVDAFIDLEKLVIGSEDGLISSPLMLCFVDEGNRVFFPKKPTEKDSEPVTYTFAASMVGQLAKGAELVAALKALNAHFCQPAPEKAKEGPDDKDDKDSEK